MNKHISLFAFTSLLSLTACGDDVNTPVTVVTQANYTYVFQDSTGKEIATQKTVNAGEINQLVPAGSSVTAYSSIPSDSVDITTVTGLEPGERIVMDSDQPATTSHKVRLPVGFANDDTRVAAWCHGDSETSSFAQSDVVTIDVGCDNPTFTAITKGPAPKLLYKKDAKADSTGMFDLSGEPLLGLKEIAVSYTGLPSGFSLGALSVNSLIGDVTFDSYNEDSLIEKQNANGLLMTKIADINGNNAVVSRLDILRGENGPLQVAITGHMKSPYSIDGNAILLPWVEAASFSAVDKKISWTTSPGGTGSPDAVIADLTFMRGTQEIKWNIRSPFTGNDIRLPMLPAGNPLSITASDTVVVETLGLLSAPGGYETLKTVPEAKFPKLLSSGGSIVYSAIGAK
jgi:hypothetical protein